MNLLTSARTIGTPAAVVKTWKEKRRWWTERLVISLVIAVLVFTIFPYLPTNSAIVPQQGAGGSDVGNVALLFQATPTPFQPKILKGSCPDGTPCMDMYGQTGINIIVFDWVKGMKVCIPEWAVFVNWLTQGATDPSAIAAQPNFQLFVGKMATRGYEAGGISKDQNCRRH